MEWKIKRESKIGVVEGTKVEITFTPNAGYMIDKVLVNTVETTVTGNKIELTVNEEKEVKVSYKKIPFTVTVKDVDGATITPNVVIASPPSLNNTFNVARVTVPTNNPQTGDNIGFYIISGILSIVGLAVAGIFYRRKQTN